MLGIQSLQYGSGQTGMSGKYIQSGDYVTGPGLHQMTILWKELPLYRQRCKIRPILCREYIMSAASHPLQREFALYERYREEFERDHHWEWVVIHADDIVGFYGDFQEAATDAVAQFGRGPYLIRQIGVPEPTLPASVLYRPVHASR